MRDILKQYSEGHITWRDAARQVGAENFAEFEALLTREGFVLYEPASAESEAKLALLDEWMDEGL